MFKENIEKIPEINTSSKNEQNVFADWEEKDLFTAGQLAELKSEEIYDFFNNFVDARGDFKNFLSSDNIKYFSQILRDIAPLSIVKKGQNPDYNFKDRNGDHEADIDYDLIFEKALPAILTKKAVVKEHRNNLSLITAAVQCREDLSDNWGSASSERNAADIKYIFKEFASQPNISVLESVYLNYLGGQFNQMDTNYIKDLKKYNPKAYQEFISEQPNIQKFQNKKINVKDLSLPQTARRALLRDKFGFSLISSEENTSWEDEGLEISLIANREEGGKLKKGTSAQYTFADSSKNKSIAEFQNSAAGRLTSCTDKINPLNHAEVEGEYIIADLSPEFFGVYSLSGNLEAFFERKSLDEKETVKSIKSHDFAEIKNQVNFRTPQDLAGFKLMSSLFFRDQLKEICGVGVEELNLRTQYQFLNFISEYPKGALKNLNEFLNNGVSEHSRADRLRSFLCLELDKNLGDKLVSLGDKFAPPQADLLYSKIAELNDLASKEESELSNLLLKDNKCFNFSSLKSELLRRAQALIIKFSQFENDKFKADEVSQIFSELENIKIEIVLFSSLLKSAKEDKQSINLEVIKYLDLRVKDYGEKMTDKDKEEVLSIAQANWSNFGNEKMAQVVIGGLEESLEKDKEQRAYILKYKDEVIGFVRFEKTDHDTIYAGSFNVSKDLRGLAIGNDMMEKALIKEGENNILEASASIKIPAGCSYIEKIGFIADGLIENYHGTGESLFNIRLDKPNNKNYALRVEGKEKPLDTASLKEAAQSYEDLDNLIGRESFVLRFDLNSEMDAYQKTLGELLPKVDDSGHKLEDAKNKYTLTRYFYDKEEDPRGNIRYLAFEKNR